MRNRRVSLAVSSVLAALLALTACGSEGAEKDAEKPGGLLSSVETMFGTVEIPQPADGELTVVALGWSDAEAALALGTRPVAVYDWLETGAENKAVGPWATELFGDVTPEIVKPQGEELNYEQIQALEPDLILNTRSSGDEKQFKRLSEIAPTVYAPEGTPAYATSWQVQTQLVADALGESAKGKELVEQVEEKIKAAADAHPEFKGKVAVSGSKFGEAYGASIAGDARWDVLESLGFTQKPEVLKLEPSGFFVNVSVEQVKVLDADVTVLFPIGYKLKDLESDPLISALDVVKEGRSVFLGDARSDSTDAHSALSLAFSATSILSVPIAVDGLVPLLAEAASKG